jgi:hypothetical protein
MRTKNTINRETEMKRTTSFQFRIVLIALLNFVLWASPAFAQNAPAGQGGNNAVKTDTKMLYHDGPVLPYIQNVYLIF